MSERRAIDIRTLLSVRRGHPDSGPTASQMRRAVGRSRRPCRAVARRSEGQSDGRRNAFRFQRLAASCVGAAELAAAALSAADARLRSGAPLMATRRALTVAAIGPLRHQSGAADRSCADRLRGPAGAGKQGRQINQRRHATPRRRGEPRSWREQGLLDRAAEPRVHVGAGIWPPRCSRGSVCARAAAFWLLRSIEPVTQLSSTRALVTGGTSGLGRAMASRAGRRGRTCRAHQPRPGARGGARRRIGAGVALDVRDEAVGAAVDDGVRAARRSGPAGLQRRDRDADRQPALHDRPAAVLGGLAGRLPRRGRDEGDRVVPGCPRGGAADAPARRRRGS